MFSSTYNIIEEDQNSQLFKVANKLGKVFYAKQYCISSLLPSQIKRIIATLNCYMQLTQDSLNYASKNLLTIRFILQEDEFIYIIADYEPLVADLNESKIIKIFEYTRLALRFLHSKSIVHGNINITNIFATENNYKLGILNLDEIVFSGHSRHSSSLKYSPFEFKKPYKNFNGDLKSLAEMITTQAKLCNCFSPALNFHIKSLEIATQATDSVIQPIVIPKNGRKGILKRQSIFSISESPLKKGKNLESKRPPMLTVDRGSREFTSNFESISAKNILPVIKKRSILLARPVNNCMGGVKSTIPSSTFKKKVSLQDIFSL